MYFPSVFALVAYGKTDMPRNNVLLVIVDDMKGWTGFLDGLDGHDMTPLLEGKDSSWNYPAATEIKVGSMSVRDRRYRYIKYKNGEEELYGHEKDPLEWHNLSSDAGYETVRKELAKRIPSDFAEPLPGKKAFYFDPEAYSNMNRMTKEYIDGRK